MGPKRVTKNSTSTCGEDADADERGYKEVLLAIENIKQHFEKRFNEVLSTINMLTDRIKLVETEQLSHADSLKFMNAEIEVLKNVVAAIKSEQKVREELE